MWNWLRNPKSLAVITAGATVIGFVWTELTASKGGPTAPLTSSLPSISINIEAKQANAQTVLPDQAPPLMATTSAQVVSTEKTVAPEVQQRFPVRRQLANGVPNEVLSGFWLTLAGYEGTESEITAYLHSQSWGDRPLSFKVGGAPFDFSHSGGTYQLTVESMKDERVIISVRR